MRDSIRQSFLFDLCAIALFSLCAPGPCPAAESSGLKPLRLRCEYKLNPLGIDTSAPRLDWIVESNERGRKQSAYRILVASSEANLAGEIGDLWDTGKVDSDETIQIPYAGKPLESGARCFWKLMVWDNQGRPSPWSAPATWSMGLLKAEDWKARWIGLDSPLQSLDRKTYLALTMLRNPFKLGFGKIYLPSPHLRKEFKVEKPVRRATLYATALGLYEIRINGARVGADYFTPGWTDYNRRIYYQTYDVTSMLRPGANALAAILSDGWYAGNVGGRGQRIYGSKLRLRGQLQIEYEDGSNEVVLTDQSWRASCGPIREADMQAGEAYDARLEMPGWDQPGFDDRDWKRVDLTESVSVPLEAYPGIPVRKTLEIRPIELNSPRPGVYVFNLGQNFAGWAKLKVQGGRGDKVTLRFAERLNKDGNIYTLNLRSARATDSYVLKGSDVETWEPRFTYHGFQYVELTGFPGTPTLDSITGIVAHSDLRITSSFESSDPLVNKIYLNTLWGQRSNYFEVPTDCPQRDERLGWTGDAQVFIPAAAFNMDVAPFFTKWLVDLEDGQYPDGAFPDVAPRVAANAAAGWGDAGIICPRNIFRFYGDKRILEKHYQAMARYLQFLTQRSPGYLSPPLGTYGDWLNLSDPTPGDLIATAYFGYSAKLMAQMSAALGNTGDAEKYQSTFENVGKAFTERYTSPNGRISGDSQTGYLMALRFGLIPQELRPAASEQLINKIKDRDWSLSTGFLGASLLLPTLSDIGRTDVAYRLILNTRYPSWGYPITQGATTMWERWNSYTQEHGFNTPQMNSFNHYAYGAVSEWIFTTLAGIDTDGPGFKKIIIRPRPGGGITYAKASYDSIRGKITTHWRIQGSRFQLELTIPANTTATVFIPAQKPEDVFESGLPANKSPGVHFLRMQNTSAVFELGSGAYAFTSKGH